MVARLNSKLAVSIIILLAFAIPAKAQEFGDYAPRNILDAFAISNVVVKANYAGVVALSDDFSHVHSFEVISVKKGSADKQIQIGGIFNGINSQNALTVGAGTAVYNEAVGRIWYLFLRSSADGEQEILSSIQADSFFGNYIEIIASASRGASSDPGVFSFLKSCLNSSDPLRRYFALNELQSMDGSTLFQTSDVEKFVGIVTEDQKYESGRPERFLALSLIVQSGELAEQFLPALIHELDGLRGRFVTSQLAEILRIIPTSVAINILNTNLSENNPYTKMNAAEVIRIIAASDRDVSEGFCDPILQANLIDGLNNQHSIVRQYYIVTIGEIGCPGVDAVLINYYSLADYEEKRRIIHGLVHLGSPEAIQFVELISVAEFDPALREFSDFMLNNRYITYF